MGCLQCQWGDIRVSILEAEWLLPMPEVPKVVEILHMEFVIVAFSAAGISTRNRRNWGRRQFSSNSSLAEMVLLGGADWAPGILPNWAWRSWSGSRCPMMDSGLLLHYTSKGCS